MHQDSSYKRVSNRASEKTYCRFSAMRSSLIGSLTLNSKIIGLGAKSGKLIQVIILTKGETSKFIT